MKKFLTKSLDILIVFGTLPSFIIYCIFYTRVYKNAMRQRVRIINLLMKDDIEPTDKKIIKYAEEFAAKECEPIAETGIIVSFIVWVLVLVIILIWQFPNLYI